MKKINNICLYSLFILCFPIGVYGFDQGQSIGDQISDVSLSGTGTRFIVQKFEAATTTTIRRLITYPAPGNPNYTDCRYSYDSGGAPSTGFYNSDFSTFYDGFVSANTGVDENGACYYDFEGGQPINAGDTYYLRNSFRFGSDDTVNFYGTTAGGANFGYRTTAPSLVLGTLYIQNSKYWISDSTSFNPPPPDQRTRFTSVEISTSTQQVSVSGYINPQWSGTTNRIRFNQSNILFGNWRFEEVLSTSSGAFSYTFDYNPVVSSSTVGFDAQTFDFQILNYTGCQTDFGQTVICPQGQPILAATSTDYILDPFSPPESFLTPEAYADLVGSECSLTEIDGCIRNGLMWAFNMSPQASTKYDALIQILRTKEPLGVVFYAYTSVRSISASTTPSFTFVVADGVKTGIVDPFRVAIPVLIVVFHLFALYKWGHKIQF